MTQTSVTSKRKRPMLAHTRGQLIFYMGKFVNDSSSSLAPLKKIVGSKEFEGLLTLLSGVGTRSVIKLLENAYRNCAAKKAERAKGKNAGKAADAASDGPGRTKRSKLHETGRSSDHAKGTAYEESGAPQPLLSYSKKPDIQRSSEESQIYSGSYNGNHTRRQTVGLSRRSLKRDVEVEDTKSDASPYTAKLHHSGPSSSGNNDSRSSVEIEYEDWASKSMENIGNLRENLGQAEDKHICSRKRHRSAYENEAETTDIGTTYPSGFLATKEKALQLESQDMYKREVGIIRRDPEIVTPIEDHCCTTLVDVSKNRRGNLKKEVSQLLTDIEQLDFLFAKDRLVKYLKNRQAKMGMQTETPATWTMSEPQQVLGALRTIRTICDDAHIHRAFGQMKLCLLVQGKLESGYRPIPSGKGKLRLPETNYLEELARREAGLSSEDDIEAKLRDYLAEHQAGKRWLQVADWFGGPSIVLVFVTAGIGSYHVAAGWKVFQRHCLKYISQSLYSIKGLVGALGIDCLEKYCQCGHLPQNYINKVIEFEGIIPAEEINEDGSEMDETEEDASDAEVHGKEEENGIKNSDSDEELGSGEATSGDEMKEDASDAEVHGKEEENGIKNSDSDEEAGSGGDTSGDETEDDASDADIYKEVEEDGIESSDSDEEAGSGETTSGDDEDASE